MTLAQLATEYRRSGALIRERMALLQGELRRCGDPQLQRQLRQRLKELAPLYRDCRRLARYMERYYDRRG